MPNHSEREFRAAVTWTSGTTERRSVDTERQAVMQVERWQRLNPGDVRDAWIERRVTLWERV